MRQCDATSRYRGDRVNRVNFFRGFFLVNVVLIGFSTSSFGTTDGRGDLLPLGSSAPNFSLPDVTTGRNVSLENFAGKKILMVVFICRHCPYVQHVKGVLAQLGRDYKDKGVAIVAIASNDADAYAVDAPPSLAEMAKEEGFLFPFLYDESQAVAHAYTAVATPDPFVFDQNRKLVYRGQFDDTRPNGPPATGKDIRAALDALLRGQPVSTNQKRSVGCSIKWK